MNKSWLWISGIISAAGAVILCAIPPLLLLIAGAGTYSFIPEWLDSIVAPVLVVIAAVLFIMWKRKNRKC